MTYIGRFGLIFILSLAVAAFTGPQVQADIKILDSGTVKSLKTPEKSGKRSQRNNELFHRDPDHPANKFEPGEVLVVSA